ncbi:inositol monophosphatase family protein [Demequina activiva]|uniref:Inositol-1-monophosphatase n=1 Tax=Demequina activiva TaxID=1582364 RepID=A0A919UJU3_9MICO|nr:inositol monophosphatase family protein [Demequina activiva]GIG54686.1 inositol monophosphatase [Demequina activiva]
MDTAHELLDIARLIASETAALIRDGRSGARVHATKSSAIDIVTQMDLAAEAHLRERLSQLRPDDGILGEEGEDTAGSSGVTWILDPIDGTVNYLYGLPHYAVSVAAVTGPPRPREWSALAGAVADGSGVLWSAARGGGAFRDGRPLRREDAPPLESTLLATGFQYVAQRRERQGEIVTSMLGQVRDIRRLGAASVDLCLVAAGAIDAYYEHGLHAWDFAAAALIAQEAGVKVAGLDGGAADERVLVAAHPDVWDDLAHALVRAGAETTWDARRA